MSDPVYRSFCENQLAEGQALAGQSDIIELRPIYPGAVPCAYHLSFHCKTLIFDGTEVREAPGAEVGIFFPPDYLECVDPARSVSILHPFNLFHPNVLGPLICLGRVRPGTGLVDLTYQIYEILTFQKRATHDSLNLRAAQWCRNHQDQLPLDRRPLRRRSVAAGEQQTPGPKEMP